MPSLEPLVNVFASGAVHSQELRQNDALDSLDPDPDGHILGCGLTYFVRVIEQIDYFRCNLVQLGYPVSLLHVRAGYSSHVLNALREHGKAVDLAFDKEYGVEFRLQSSGVEQRAFPASQTAKLLLCWW